jgi:small conductance mechanosensitive channel
MHYYFTILAAELPTNVKFLQQAIDIFLTQGLNFLKNLIIAIIIILIGRKLIKYTIATLAKYFNRTKMEVSVSGFLLTLIKAILYILLISLVVDRIIGIGSSTVMALLGSAGLSIGLALQGGLSNFAGGVLILLLKPFRVGDYIIAGGNEGTVTSIDIFYTRLLTIDNRLLVIPNGSLSNNYIINVTNEPNRRLELIVPIQYSEDIQKVKDIISDILNKNELILKEQDISIYVNSLDINSLSIGIRVWVTTENYWTLKCELLEQIKNEFDKNQIRIPTNKFEFNVSENKAL